jgi:hypothetical protein
MTAARPVQERLFYTPSMPPALLERHGIEPEQVAAINGD